MKRFSFVVLGAGPSGLAVAHALRDAGVGAEEILVIKKEDCAGGLCRSMEIDGAPVDIGGGHFLDVRRKEVLDFIFRFMPREEWNLYDRVTKIRLRGVEIDHPLEANRVYEVLNRKRPLTMAMAWKLHKGLGIPAESLIRQAA